MINRAPVLTLWDTVMAEMLGVDICSFREFPYWKDA